MTTLWFAIVPHLVFCLLCVCGYVCWCFKKLNDKAQTSELKMQCGRHVQPLIFHFLFSKHLLDFSGNSLMWHSKKILISILCSPCILVANYESLNLVSHAQLLPGRLFWLTIANLLKWVLWEKFVLIIVFIVGEIHF